MKLLSITNGYISLEIIELTGISIDKQWVAEGDAYETKGDSNASVSRNILEDLYHISSGDSRLSMEYIQTAEKQNDSRNLHHIVILRRFDSSCSICKRIMKAAVKDVTRLLQMKGYVCELRSYQWYQHLDDTIDRSTVRALIKEVIIEQDLLSTGQHISLPVIEDDLDMSSIYGLLSESGCTISIQIIPDALDSASVEYIQQTYANLSRAADGSFLGPMAPKDGLAQFGKERWKYYIEHVKSPMVTMNILVMGANDEAVVLISRLKSIIRDRYTRSVAAMDGIVLNCDMKNHLHDMPWFCERVIYKSCESVNSHLWYRQMKNLIRKVTVKEAAAILAFPSDDGTYKGISNNAFSLLSYNPMIPEAMIKPEQQAIMIGRLGTGRNIYLPLDYISQHISIYGKTGVGKTTELLSMIEQLESYHINTMIIEPVKKEYRVLSSGKKNTKIFTVEAEALPFVMNPFHVPQGVTLQEYRPYLLKAFRAAFSMPDPLPSLFGAAITECYALFGWKGHSKSDDKDVTIFGLREFVQVFQKIVKNSQYSSEVKGNMMSGGTFRLMSLLDQGRRTFENIHSIDVEDLLNGIVVLELNQLEGEQKCLIASLILVSIVSYLRVRRRSEAGLKNVILLDEAHVLLDNGESCPEDDRNIGVTMEKLIENLVAEARALGVGVIISDQSPKRIGARLLDSTNTKIFFRLSGEEAEQAAKAIGMNRVQAGILPRLDQAEAVLSNHVLQTPIGIRTIKSQVYHTEHSITDHALMLRQRKIREQYADIYRPFQECRYCMECRKECHYITRENAYSIALQMYRSKSFSFMSTKDVLKVLVAIPRSMERQCHHRGTKDEFDRLCACVIIRFYMMVKDDTGITLPDKILASVLNKLRDNEYEEKEA